MNTLEMIMKLKAERGLSDLGLERDLGLTPRIVAGWKSGKSKTYMDILPKLADYFGVTTDYLLVRPSAKEAPAPSNDLKRLEEIYFKLTPAQRQAVLEFAESQL